MNSNKISGQQGMAEGSAASWAMDENQDHVHSAVSKVISAMKEFYAETGIRGNVLVGWGEDGDIYSSSIFSAKEISLRHEDGKGPSIHITVDYTVDL